MPHVHLTRTAEDDLLSIARYIAADNATAARDLLTRFDDAFALHAAQPLAAAVYAPRPRYRHFVVGKYAVFYEPEDDGILVARIVHAARDLPNIIG